MALAVAFAVHLGVLMSLHEATLSVDELRRSEQRYRQIIETTTEGVWVVDADQRTTFVNPKLTKMLGYEPAEMLGRTFWASRPTRPPAGRGK